MNIHTNRAYVLWGALLLFLYALLAFVVHHRVLRDLDLQILLFLQDAFPRSLDIPSSILSLLGSVEITVLVFAALVFLSPPALRMKLVVAFALVALIEVQGKTMIAQPETPDELLRYAFRFGMPTGRISTGFSFPSGHAARASFLAALGIALAARSGMGRAKKTALIALLIALEAAMLFSRVYMADHWLSDVAGGALLGIGLCLFALFDQTATRG